LIKIDSCSKVWEVSGTLTSSAPCFTDWWAELRTRTMDETLRWKRKQLNCKS
jgi:hypothetical protein